MVVVRDIGRRSCTKNPKFPGKSLYYSWGNIETSLRRRNREATLTTTIPSEKPLICTGTASGFFLAKTNRHQNTAHQTPTQNSMKSYENAIGRPVSSRQRPRMKLCQRAWHDISSRTIHGNYVIGSCQEQNLKLYYTHFKFSTFSSQTRS